MILRPQRNAVAATTLFLCAVFALPVPATAQSLWTPPASTKSASGQFVVSDSPEQNHFYPRPVVPSGSDLLRLQAPWLVVSAERFKAALWRDLGLSPGAPWSGRIFIVLQPARSTDDQVVITPQPFIRVWNYRMDLPDLVSRSRYVRALSAVILLELVNRNTPLTARPAELPAWLVDGLARRVAESEEAQVILSAPNKSVAYVGVVNSGSTPVMGSLPQTRLDEKRRGIDPLAAARRILRQSPALTFEQLNWPGDAQMNGDDGGVYLASAQLFVDSLLKLKGGDGKIRALLAGLPQCENWQSAFFKAFGEDFRSPLEVEKWWALRVVDFAARSPGPQWTLAVSREKLDAVLTVPVEIRHAANELPKRADISLQDAVRTFDADRRTAILQTRLRDLQLVQLRLAPPLANIAESYRIELANYLGDQKGQLNIWRKIIRRPRPGLNELLAHLDTLDARRREIETNIDRKTLPTPVF
jgi:hypothetical protein